MAGRLEPAPKGNRRAVKHGASARVAPLRMEAKSEDIYRVLAGDAPLRDRGELPTHDRLAVQLLAQTLCRLEDVGAWLAEYGQFTGKLRLRTNVLKHEQRLINQALKLMTELGMTPKSRAALGVDLARTADLAQAMSEPDPAKRQRLLKEAGLDD